MSTAEDVIFTHAMWRVRPGEETHFEQLWSDLTDVFSSLPKPPHWGTLIRSTAQPSLYYSFGPWPSREDIASMRAHPGVQERIAAMVALCEEATPSSYDRVRHIDVGMTAEQRGKRDLLRHTVATIAYRGGKTLRGAPPEFASYRCNDTTRTPLEILAHINDLFDWTHHLMKGEQTWKEAVPQTWESETERFFAGLHRVDEALRISRPLALSEERLFQGPLADALTHVGQLAMLRRMAGAPVKAENYAKAEITAGRVGADQVPPRREF